MDPQPLVNFSPIKENKKFTNVFTRNTSELAALKLVCLDKGNLTLPAESSSRFV